MGVLQDRVAIVTGGTQGLGAAMCRRLSGAAAHLVVADVNVAGAREVAQDIHATSDRRTFAVEVDVTDEEPVAATVNRAVEALGRLDMLVSNAGTFTAKPIDEFPAQERRAGLEVKLMGYFLCAKQAAWVMERRQRPNQHQFGQEGELAEHGRRGTPSVRATCSTRRRGAIRSTSNTPRSGA